MPMVAPGFSKGSIFGPFGHGFGLARAPCIEPLGDAGVRQSEDRGRKQRGIDRARLADGESSHRDSALASA